MAKNGDRNMELCKLIPAYRRKTRILESTNKKKFKTKISSQTIYKNKKVYNSEQTWLPHTRVIQDGAEAH
jgi:hypothetical protein